MYYMMSGSRIVGYAYDADLHCIDCAPAEVQTDLHWTDSEGNLAHPVFASDDAWQGKACGDCRTPIEDIL